MTYPKNPENVLIKNEFYPEGLTELDCYKYYQKLKPRVLKETIGRDIILFIATDINKTTIKRKGVERPYIILTPSNYDEVVHPRVVSIHSAVRKMEEFGIIDIDTDDFNQAKTAVVDVYNVMFKAQFVDSVKVRFTGKNSFHVVLNYKRKLHVDGSRLMIQEYLEKNNLKRNYTISHQKNSKVPNLDLYRNVFNAGFITEHSLSVLGLKCIEVSFRHIRSFSKEQAKIK